MIILLSWTITVLVSFILHLLDVPDQIMVDILSKLVYIPGMIFLASLTISFIVLLLFAVLFCVINVNLVEPMSLSGNLNLIETFYFHKFYLEASEIGTKPKEKRSCGPKPLSCLFPQKPTINKCQECTLCQHPLSVIEVPCNKQHKEVAPNYDSNVMSLGKPQIIMKTIRTSKLCDKLQLMTIDNH